MNVEEAKENQKIINYLESRTSGSVRCSEMRSLAYWLKALSSQPWSINDWTSLLTFFCVSRFSVFGVRLGGRNKGRTIKHLSLGHPPLMALINQTEHSPAAQQDGHSRRNPWLHHKASVSQAWGQARLAPYYLAAMCRWESNTKKSGN